MRRDLRGLVLGTTEDALLFLGDERVDLVALVVRLGECLLLVDERLQSRFGSLDDVVDRRRDVVDHQPTEVLWRRRHSGRLVQKVESFREADFPRILVTVERRDERVVDHLLDPEREVRGLLDQQVEQNVPRDERALLLRRPPELREQRPNEDEQCSTLNVVAIGRPSLRDEFLHHRPQERQVVLAERIGLDWVRIRARHRRVRVE